MFLHVHLLIDRNENQILKLIDDEISFVIIDIRLKQFSQKSLKKEKEKERKKKKKPLNVFVYHLLCHLLWVYYI